MQEETKQTIWTTRLQDHAASGQPIRSWCAVNNVTEASFHYWRKRLSRATATPGWRQLSWPVGVNYLGR